MTSNPELNFSKQVKIAPNDERSPVSRAYFLLEYLGRGMKFGGRFGNYTIGVLDDRTQTLTASFGFIAFVYVGAGILILYLRRRQSSDTFTRCEPLMVSTR